MRRSRRWIAGALAGALAGCVSSADKNTSSSGKGTDKTLTPTEVVAAQSSAALTRAKSCDDLLSRIQNDVASKIVLQAELMRLGQQGGYSGGGVASVGHGIATGTTTGFANSAPGSAPVPQGSAPASAPAKGASDASGSSGTLPPAQNTGSRSPAESAGNPTGHSDTNVQVDGVDEADIVKTDGTHIYLLHGNNFFVLKSWPADQTALEGQGTPIEGSVLEMFVEKTTAVVFSSVYDEGDLIDEPAPAADGSAVGPRYYGYPFTKITLLDLSATPKVTRELLFEGNYLSARRYDHTVRTVIQGGFRTPSIYAGNIEYQDPWGRKYPQAQIDDQVDEWRDRMLASIATTKLEDWVPAEREVVNGKLSAPTRRCTDFYAPSPGLTDYGLTNIVSFDMEDAKSALSGAIVLGAADEVYSNESVMLLAHRDYRWDEGLIERERTVLHSFDLNGADTNYSASGLVPGQIIDQFSLDELDGVVRVATTSRIWPNFKAPLPALAAAATKQDSIPDSQGTVTLARTTDNRVSTLRAKGDSLVRVGITDSLGNDGETLQSSRFVGNRGYVVTFHQTDPLMVIDLSQPEQPTLLGELDIPGFSDYMHPIDDTHLLTIGRDADPTTGLDKGLMLQIFDVSDATAPRRTRTYKFGPNGYSAANDNHKAFTFYKPEGAVDYAGYLAIPYVNYSAQFQSTLEVFKVSLDNGFTRVGTIDHTQLLENVCATTGKDIGGTGTLPVYFNQCVQPDVERGLFVVGTTGQFVYSISSGGVLAHDLSDLSMPVATVQLPFPDYSDHRVCYDSTSNCNQFGVSGGGVSGVGSSGTASGPTPNTPATDPTPPPDAKPAVPAAMGSAGAGQ